MQTIEKRLQKQFLKTASKTLKSFMSVLHFTVNTEESNKSSDARFCILSGLPITVTFNNEDIRVIPIFYLKGTMDLDFDFCMIHSSPTELSYFADQLDEPIELTFIPRGKCKYLDKEGNSIKVNLKDYFTDEQIEDFKMDIEDSVNW